MKKRFFTLIASLLGFFVLATIAWVLCPSLPSEEVNATYTMPGANSFFDITLTGIPLGYDIANGVYTGWCIEDNGRSNYSLITLYCSYDSVLPGNFGLYPWDKINYLLNHKLGTWQEVQAVLWTLTGFSSWPLSSNAQAMYDDAMNNGAGFIPGPGEIVAIILYTGDGGIHPDGRQDTIIELSIPGDGAGCTPGYWKNHLDSWAPTGYSPSDDFDTVFGVDFFDPDITLDDAVNMGGGGIKKIARHGTAALLSAAHPDVNYPYTVPEVISIVQSGMIDVLVLANELGCPID